jgi:hypothetical protein
VDAGDFNAGLRFLGRLPAFLHGRVTAAEAAAIARRRLAGRGRSFTAFVKAAVYDRPDSPYLPLLRRAGSTFGDLERLVATGGVEAALETLLREGVYLTVDEFKGRRPVRRGDLEFQTSPESLRNPLSAFHIPVRSSGSRGAGTPVLIDLRFVADCAVNACLLFESRGGANWVKADWEVPGGGALFRLLKFSRFGRRPERWFSQIDPSSPGLHPRYRRSAWALRWGSVAATAPLPALETVTQDDPRPIVLWMREVLDRGETPLLFTFPSAALLVVRAAEKEGVELAGAHFLVGGEPITAARTAAVKRSGAEIIARYGSIECGPIGYACLEPEASDDLHLNSDLHAVIQAGGEAERIGLPAEALFVTGLRPRAPFVFLNVSMGDRGEMAERRCGCVMEKTWGTRHLRHVRSFEKLTGAGMTFADADVIRVLEEILPARFGGSPADYQLVEEEGEDGTPVMRLLVRPDVGPLVEEEVARALIDALSGGGEGDVRKVMGLAWERSGLLRVERRAPLATASGKILHLFLKKK